MEPEEMDRLRRQRERDRVREAYAHDPSFLRWVQALHTQVELKPMHAILALNVGDVILVPDQTGDLWWFVTDVNGVEQTITAKALMFRTVYEQSISFPEIRVASLSDAEHREAAIQFRRTRQ